ncbi:Carboxypeptidase Taq [Klebsormidium nitens]|uniref:Carboxypeptidase Taq n=1 Tax=Klebsormidium nitens TaxID=105231 RepID=A0A1Y1HT69_KLENI|nr:Carboxypeptidase Taq [Klebsormidium nitens]|eukprot:GAQ81313.1 Carboxypeptidase Taq [Klebsormidium nitens]
MINGGCVGHEVEDDCDGCQIGPFERAVVRDALKKQQKRAAVPARIAQRSAELASEGFQAWLKAREANDFSVLAPILEEWVALTQEKCQLIDSSQTPYDICLDEFERGMTSQRLDEVFSEVKKGLLPLLSSIRARGVPPSNDWIKGSYNPDEQAKLCLRICTDLGFMLDQGRLDVSAHPFTGETHPTDVRMTTRFKEGCLMEGLQGAIHETGHALYEQGRNMEYEGLPVSEPLSTGVHESQSLLWERMVAGGLPFCHYLLPVIKEHFPEFPATATAGDLYRAMNMVHDPSLVRTESDEVTYPMHVVLRYELERDLINGTIQVADLPRLWNEKMLEYLGCTPPDDARGILQDVHWSSGMFGYFPTYSLGAMYACQMFEQAKKELPDLEQDIAAGQFSQLRDWLYSEIHQVGSLYESGDHLMEKLTGSQLRPECFLQYLRDKYGPLYQLEEPQLAESINSADES